MSLAVFLYTLPVLVILKNCSIIIMQCAAIVSSSNINDIINAINGNHIATATTAALEVRQLQCNTTLEKERKKQLLDLETNKFFGRTLFVAAAFVQNL